LLYKIALSLIPLVGDITAKKLVSYCGSPEAVFREKKSNLSRIPNIGNVLANSIVHQDVLKKAEKEILFIEKNNIKVLFYTDNEYPHRLNHCIDSPILLYYKGNADLNIKKIISVVGSRNATSYGKEKCEEIIKGLSNQDILIISGLAYGIDACAHKSSLDNGMKTVGILGHGLDKIYPNQNRELAKRMIEKGGLITEFMSKTIPNRENFPKRNRIIAGMSDAVIVVEARKKSGAIITADIANSYNRDVFAVPGRINDALSYGCNNLIKTNRAALLQSADDIKYIMGWDDNIKNNKSIQNKLFVELNPQEKIIVELLKGKSDCGIDWIYLNSKLSMSKVSALLLNLEFKGIVKTLPGKRYKLL